MNQILMTEPYRNKKKKKKPQNSGGKADIKSVVRFFAIVIILFGVILSGTNSFALVKRIEQKKLKIEPTVTTERSGNSINLTVKHEKGIRSVAYEWNDSGEKIVPGRSQKEVKAVVNIPSGDNKLTITVLDINNNTTRFVKNYAQEAKDVTEPKIEVSNDDPRIKITVTDDTALDYIIYKYGNEQEVKVEGDGSTKIERTIDDVLAEETVLIVEAIDKSQNRAVFQQVVKGARKPKIEVTPDPVDPSYVIIKVTDEDALRMVYFKINEDEFSTNPDTALGTKEFEYRLKIEQVPSYITVRAHNLSERTEEFKGRYDY